MHFLVFSVRSSDFANRATRYDQNQNFEEASSNFESAAIYYNVFVARKRRELEAQEAICSAIKQKARLGTYHGCAFTC